MLTDKTIGNKPGAVMEVSPSNVDEIALKVLKRDLTQLILKPYFTVRFGKMARIKYLTE